MCQFVLLKFTYRFNPVKTWLKTSLNRSRASLQTICTSLVISKLFKYCVNCYSLICIDDRFPTTDHDILSRKLGRLLLPMTIVRYASR